MVSDVFISYAHEDADWVRALAERLERGGVRVYFDEWDLMPGTVAVHELDEAIRRSGSAIQVLSPVALAKPWVREEYAALLQQSVERGLRFIPIIYGEVEIPPFAANRVSLDFRKASGRAYDDRVADLVGAIRGDPRPRGAAHGRASSAARPRARCPNPTSPRSLSAMPPRTPPTETDSSASCPVRNCPPGQSVS